MVLGDVVNEKVLEGKPASDDVVSAGGRDDTGDSDSVRWRWQWQGRWGQEWWWLLRGR